MNKLDLFDTLLKAIEQKITFLEDKPEENPSATLKALWMAAAGIPVAVIHTDNIMLPDLTEAQIKDLYAMLARRIANIPLAHITGRQGFMGIELVSDKRALIPRRETEILGRLALSKGIQLAEMENRIKIADICCGAGNLGLALATHIPSAVVLETDLSKDAVALTAENILFLGLTQRVKAIPGDLFEACNSDNDFASDIDLIVCNPPYISSGKVPKMKAEISENEPVLAFDGGMLGTRIILRLISESLVFLKSGGWLCFEVGLGQGDFAAQLCERSGHYQKIETAVDSKGNVRSIAAQRK